MACAQLQALTNKGRATFVTLISWKTFDILKGLSAFDTHKSLITSAQDSFNFLCFFAPLRKKAGLFQHMQKQNQTHLLSRRLLAARWAVSKETLKRREKAGLLPFLKLGRDVRYRLADIEQIEAQAEVRL